MAGEPLGQMIIELGLDSSSFGKGLDGAKKATKYAMAEMKSNMAVMGQAGNKYEALKVKQAGLTKVIETQTKEVLALKKAYDGSLVNGEPGKQTAKLATQLQNANAKLGSFNTQLVNNAKNMAMAKVQTTGMTGAINNVGKVMTSSGNKLSSMGSTMTRNFTAPIVAGMGYATKSAIDFDSQISQMGPLLTNGGAVTAKFKRELDAMAESSKKWSKQYGVSTTEINNGMSELIKRGFTSQQVMGSMPSILDATKASGEDMGVVMQATASIVEQFGLKTNSTAGTMKNTQRVTDSLTYAANATAAGFGDMSEAMSYVGPVASSLGLSVEQTAAAVGELSNQGIEGQKAGTNLRGILTSLIKPTKQNMLGFQSMGISAKQLAHDSHDLPQLIDDITKGTKGWKNAERGKALAQAFGRENQAAANALVKAGSSSLRELTTETQNATGATKKVADQMNGTKANQIKRFQESLHVLAIETGEKLLPTLMPIVQDATKMVDAFGKLDSATQQNILRTGMWVAAAGPVSKIAGGTLKSIGSLATGYVDLSAKIEGFAAGKIAKRELGMAEVATKTLGTTTSHTTATMTQDMLNWTNNLGKTGPQAEKTVLGIGESMGATAGKTGLLSAAMSPLGLTVIGVTAAVGLGVTAWNLWGKEAMASMASTAKWGTNVSDNADKSLTKMQGFSTGVSNALDGFASKSESTTKAVASNFDGMYKQLETDSKQSFKKMQSDINDLPSFAKAAAEKDLANKKKTNAAVVADAKVQNQTVQTLLKKHNGDVQSLSDDEKQIVLNARTRINADELKLLQIGGKAKKVVLETLNGDVSKLSRQRRDQDVLDLSAQYTKEKKIYENQSTSIKKAYKDGAISADTYKKSMKELESSHKSSVDNMAAATLKLDRANGKSKDEIKQDLGVYETSYKRAAEIVDGQTKKMSKSTSLIAADTNSMSKATAKANDQWNSLVFDPKTGKVKTNAQEEITKAAKSKDGWNSLVYDLKHANLSSNAKQMIANAALESGNWNKLSWREQKALIKTNSGEVAVQAITDAGQWDSLTFDQKKALVNSNSKSEVATAVLSAGQWNALSWKEQKALIKSNSGTIAVQALTDAGTWDRLSFAQKNAVVNSNSKQATAQALMDSGQWNSLDWEQQDALVATNAGRTIFDAMTANGIWNQLTFEQQKAIISSNSKSAINQAVIASDQWDKLSFKQQKALITSNSAKVAVDALHDSGIWNSLPLKQKRAIITSNSKQATAQAVMDAGQWNKLTWSQQDALVVTNTGRTIMDAMSANGTWNQLTFDQQKAIVTSNSKSEVAKAVLATDQWAKLSFKEQKALVSSNAGQKVMEGLQASGNWKGLSFETKKAILEGNSKAEVRQAVIAQGIWSALSFKKQEMLVDNKASRAIMEALNDAGTWNKLDVKTQQAVVESKGLPQLADSIIQMDNWNKLPADMKKLLVSNDDAKQKLIAAGIDLSKYDNQKPLPKKLTANADDYNRVLESAGLKVDILNGKKVETKYLNANNQVFVEAVTKSTSLIGEYNSMPAEMKQLLAENGDVVTKLNTSKSFLAAYNSLSPDMKKLMADTYGFDEQINQSTGKITFYNTNDPKVKLIKAKDESLGATLVKSGNDLDNFSKNNPPSKLIKGQDAGLASAVQIGNGQINGFKSNNPASKPLKGHDAGLGGVISLGNAQVNNFKSNNPASKPLKAHDGGLASAVTRGNNSLNIFSGNNPSSKSLRARDNASGPARDASNAVDNFSRKKDHTITLTSIFKTIEKKIKGNERGTNHHPGGPMMVNDQAGPTFRELIQRPNGFSFIPEGRNVILPNEPVGTKVITASRTNRLLGGIPQFANGTAGIPADAQILKNIDQAQSALTNQTINISGGNNDELVRNQQVQIKIQQSQLDIMHTLVSLLTNQSTDQQLDIKQLANLINQTNQADKNLIRYNQG